MPGTAIWTCAGWAYAALLAAATQPGPALTAAVLSGALVTGALLAGTAFAIALLAAGRAGRLVPSGAPALRRAVSVRRRAARVRPVRVLDPDAAGRPRSRAPGPARPAA